MSTTISNNDFIQVSVIAPSLKSDPITIPSYYELYKFEQAVIFEMDMIREASQADWRKNLAMLLHAEDEIEETISTPRVLSRVEEETIPEINTEGTPEQGHGFHFYNSWANGLQFDKSDPETEFWTRPEIIYLKQIQLTAPHLDEFFSVVESFLIYIYNWRRATTASERYMCVLTYIKCVNKESITSQIVTSDGFAMLVTLASDMYRGEPGLQSDDDTFKKGNLDILQECMDKFDTFKESKIYAKVYKFCMYALSMSFFDKLGITFDSCNFTELEAEAIKKKHHMGVDFVYTMLDTCLFISKKAQQAYNTGSLSGILIEESKYQKWFETSSTLVRQSKYLSNPEVHGIDVYSYMSDLNKCLEEGKVIAKFNKRMTPFEKNSVSKILYDLESARCQYINKTAAAKDRKAPFSLLIYGGSSVGKSSILNTIFVHYGKVFGLRTNSEYKYTRLAQEKHWNNFSSEKWCIVLDDIAMLKPNASQGIDPSLAEVILLNNNVAFTPEQAALENKGNTPALPKLLLATTNVKDINVHAYFSCPLAVSRRLPWVIDVRPKSEFAKHECMLDGTLLPIQEEGVYNDFWDFLVYRVEPMGTDRDGQRAQLIEDKVYTNIDDFLAWMSEEAVKHDKSQDRVMASNKISQEVEVCKTCYRSVKRCSCTDIQSLDVDIFWYSFLFTIMYLVYSYLNKIIMYVFFKYTFNKYWRVVLDKTKLINILSYSGFLVTKKNAAIIFSYLGHRVHNMSNNQSKIAKLVLFLTTSLISYQAYRAIQKHFVKKEQKKAVVALKKADEEVEYMLNEEKVLQDMTVKMPQYIASAREKADKALEAVVELFPNSRVLQSEYVSDSIGKAPGTDIKDHVNVWYKEEMRLLPLDVSPTTLSLNGKSRSDIMAMLQNNCVYFCSRHKVDSRLAMRKTRAVCLVGHIYMCNNHGMPQTPTFDLQVISDQVGTGINTNITFKITQKMIHRIPSLDLAFLNLRQLPLKKNIMKFLPKVNLNGVFNGFYISRNSDGDIVTNDLTNVRYKPDRQEACLPDKINLYMGNTRDPCDIGDCGSLMIFESNLGPVFAGIHIMGNKFNTTIGSIALTQDVVSEAIKSFSDIIMQAGDIEISAPTCERSLGPLHPKSVLRYIENGTCAVYGSFSGFKPSLKSAVKNSVISGSMVARGYDIKHGAPQMKGWLPWRNAMLDMSNPVCDLDSDILKECADSFLEDVLTKIAPEDLAEVFVYDNFTAINGAIGVAYVDKMNHSTSAGAPWKKSKRNFIVDLPPQHGFDAPVTYNEEIMTRVDLIIDNYKKGIVSNPVFCGNLKDEPKTFKKIISGGTRVFAGAPGDWSIVVRKYLLSVVRMIQNNRFIFESAPGTIAQSTQWEEIREFLTTFGEDTMVAGDYKAFDKRMPACVILASFDIIIGICVAAGYSKEDLMVVKGIAEDTAFPLMDFNGDLIRSFGSNPSGHPLTVIINGLANSLYMRYCFCVLNKKHKAKYTVRQFQDLVKLITYGDDNAMGVSSEIPWYNHTEIQSALADVDITYTMAEKEAKSVPYIHINEVSFLKRTFRDDKDVGAFVGPLEHDSIVKMLTVNVASKSVTPEYQAVQTISTAVREYFFYGKDIFNEKSEMLKQVVIENGLQAYVEDSTFPTWESLNQQFWDASLSTQLRRKNIRV
jgi:hypothetical protein